MRHSPHHHSLVPFLATAYSGDSQLINFRLQLFEQACFEQGILTLLHGMAESEIRTVYAECRITQKRSAYDVISQGAEPLARRNLIAGLELLNWNEPSPRQHFMISGQLRAYPAGAGILRPAVGETVDPSAPER